MKDVAFLDFAHSMFAAFAEGGQQKRSDDTPHDKLRTC